MPKVGTRVMAAAKKELLTAKAEESGDYPVPVPSQVLPPPGVGPVAVDTETSGLYADDGARVAIVSIAWDPTEGRGGEDAVVAYAFPFDQGARDKIANHQTDLFDLVDYNLPHSEWVYLLAWLRANRMHVYQNAKFDLEKLRVGTRHWEGEELLDSFYWDTMIASKEAWPTELTGLKQVAARLWGEDQQDEMKALKRFLGPATDPRYDLVPWNVIGPYATKDAVQTIRIFWHQQAMIEEGELDRATVLRELEYSRCLYLMEKRGMPFDVSGALSAYEQIEEAKAGLAAKLPFVPSVNGAKAYYFGDPARGGLGLRPLATTPTGKPQLNEEVMREMTDPEVYPHVDTYQLWRKLDTAGSMWYKAYAEMTGADGRLRTNFRQTKVVSGRVSVERFQAQALPHGTPGVSGKLKLLPKGMPSPRDLFTFPEGMEVDLAQAELRVAAKRANCRTMIEMIEAGDDLHGYVTTDLFGVRKGDPEWFDFRQVGKRGNFSFIFGVGAKTFRETVKKLLGIEFSLQEAEDIVRKWNRLFPEFKGTIHEFSRFAMRNRYVVLANGKRRYFAERELEFGCHQAFNQYVQPSLAELAKDWTIDTERRHPGVLVMTVHDSQYLDCPVGEGEAIAADVAARAGELGTEMFGIVMEADVSKWGEH